MKIKPFRALYPNFDFIASPDAFCDNAKESFREFQSSGLFSHFPEAAFYIYQIEDGVRLHTGLVTLNEVEDFFAGKMKKHEKTLSEKEQHQMQLFLRWNAILKPVLLTYPSVPEIDHWLGQFTRQGPQLCAARFEKDGQVHRIWPVTAPADIAQLQALFAEHVHRTYIADGHHRTSTIALLHERLRDREHQDYDFDHLFCAFFGAAQLDILDYNRVVESPKDLSLPHFLIKMSKIFELDVLDDLRRPLHKHEMLMYLRKAWYVLRWKPDILQSFPADRVLLDAALLNERVMRDILGIQDVRTDSRIRYVEGSKGLRGIQKVANERRNSIGFALYPVDFDDLMRMADLDESLPPKSTYFEPRLRSGMLVKLLKN
jgi:uncharacterized protein (DUF1015 family)